MKYIITGVTGAIGFSLIQKLLEQNHEVTVLLNPNSSRNSHIENILPKNVIYLNFSQYVSFKCKEKFDIFIHMAWKGGLDRLSYETNYLSCAYSIEAVDLASRLGCTTFIATGSQAECGVSKDILNENTECNPTSAFGLAKYSAMNACKQRCKTLGLRFVWLRVLSVFGDHDRTSTMLYSLINNLLKGNRISLSSGNQYWDFLHSDDIANALILLSRNRKSEGLYVVGEGTYKKLKNYISIISDTFNINCNDILGKDDSIVTYNLRCQTTRLKDDIGWTPEISFEDGISRFIEYVKYNECE